MLNVINNKLYINDQNQFKQRKVVAKSGILTIYFVGYDPDDDPNDYYYVTSLISVAEGITLGI